MKFEPTTAKRNGREPSAEEVSTNMAWGGVAWGGVRSAECGGAVECAGDAAVCAEAAGCAGAARCADASLGCADAAPGCADAALGFDAMGGASGAAIGVQIVGASIVGTERRVQGSRSWRRAQVPPRPRNGASFSF